MTKNTPQQQSRKSFWAIGLLVGFLLLSAPHLKAQGPPELFPDGVANGAGFRPPDFPGGRAAPGSIISVFGRNLGPQDPVSSTELPLRTRLGPLETRVLVNGTTECPLFFASEGQVNCQLPEELMGDRVRLRVITTMGESDEVTVPLGPFGFGLFTMNRTGRGPLVAQNFTGDPDPQRRFRLNGPETPARAGQILVLWGTGLGPTDPPVQAGQGAPGQAPAVNQPEVWVGNTRARVQYAGRAPGFAGLDQIQIELPEDAPLGCAVPLRLQIGNQISNMGAVAIGPGSGRCMDPLENITSGMSHGSVVLSSGLGRLGPGQLGPGRGFGGPFPRGGMGPGGGMGGPGDGMGFGGGVGAGPGGVGPQGIGPLGVHPGIPPHAGGFGPGMMQNLGPDMVVARFVRLGSDAMMDIGIPPAASNTCTSYFQGSQGNADLFMGPVQFLDAGELTVTGPGVDLSVSAQEAGMGVLYAAALPGSLEQGSYGVQGMGGADVSAFGPVELTIPDLVNVTTSLEPGTTISRQEGLTIAWTGGQPDDLVVIHGRSFFIPEGTEFPVGDPLQFRSQAFVCSTTAGEAQFAIPASVLNSLPDGMLSLNITHMPSADGIARFDAAGLDLGGVFRWLDTTAYLDLVLGP